MDINSLIIALAIVVTSAILLYMIHLFTMKGGSYEEMMEEQKRRIDAESERLKMLKKAEREHAIKKKVKKKPEKVKDVEGGAAKTLAHPDTSKPAKKTEIVTVPLKKQVVATPTVKQQVVATPTAKHPVGSDLQAVKQQRGEATVKQQSNTASPVKQPIVTSPSVKPDVSTSPVKKPVEASAQQKHKKEVQADVEQKVIKHVKEQVKVVKAVADHKLKKNDVIEKPLKEKEVNEVGRTQLKVKKVEHPVTVAEEVKENVSPKNAKKSNEPPKSDVIRPQDTQTNESQKVTTKPEEIVQEKKKIKRDVPEKPKAAAQEESKQQSDAASTKNAKIVIEAPVSRQVGQTLASAPVSQKPKAKPALVIENGVSDVTSLLACIKRCPLSETDVHTVIEALNGKHGDRVAFTSIKKKGDPLTLLRNQLEEKEKALQEEQQMAMAANNRLKVVKAELSQEKSRYMQLEKSSVDKVTAQAQEVQALQARMQQSHESHLRDMEGVRSQHDVIIQKIGEENNNLKESLTQAQAVAQSNEVDNLKKQVKIMHTEMNNNAIKLNASEREKKSLEQAVDKKMGNEKVMSKRLEETLQQVNKEEAKNKQMNQDLHKSADAVNVVKKECHGLKAKLKELERDLQSMDHASRAMDTKLKAAENEKAGMTANVRNLEQQLKVADLKCADVSVQLQEVQAENQALSEELKTSHERRQGEGEEAPNGPAGSSSGEVHDETQKADVIDVTEHEIMLCGKEKEIAQLAAELDNQSEEITDLKSQMETQKQKNNELREKNWKAMSALETAEKNAQIKADQSIKVLSVKHGEALVECQNQDKGVYQRVFPNILIDSHMKHTDWMNCFEHEATEFISELSRQSRQPVEMNTALQIKLRKSEEQIEELQTNLTDMDVKLTTAEGKMCAAATIAEDSQAKIQEAEQRLSEMETKEQEANNYKGQLEGAEKHIEKLEEQINDYRGVLCETEQKFKELEGNVDIEESRWRIQVDQYESDLMTAKEEIDSLQKKVEQSQAIKTTVKPETAADSSDIGFAYRCVEKSLTSIVDEMEDRAEKLEIELGVSEQSRQTIQDQFAEAQENIIRMQTEIAELEKSAEKSAEMSAIVEEIKTNLQDERAKSKTFASEIVKLKAIVRIGQDALREEENLVKRLQENHAGGDQKINGTDGDTSQLKAKLQETQTQLERELAMNRQLNQRLIIMSASTGNDVGTSV